MVSTRSVRYKFSEGERVLCYEPDPTKAKVLYDSKVLEVIESKDKRGRRTVEYLIHFQGWNSSWDRCVSEDFVLKDTEENRQLQRDLAEKSQLQLGAYLYRRERKKGSTSSAGAAPAKRARQGFSDDGSSSSTQPDEGGTEGEGEAEDETGDTDSSSGSGEREPRDLPHSHLGRANLNLPSALRDRLTFDYHLVVKRGRLSRLPAAPNAAQILESFVKWFARAGAWHPPRGRNDPPQKPDLLDVSCRLNLVREVADGLRVYFDFILRGHLLYKQEMQQYHTLCGQFVTEQEKKVVKEEVEDDGNVSVDEGEYLGSDEGEGAEGGEGEAEGVEGEAEGGEGEAEGGEGEAEGGEGEAEGGVGEVEGGEGEEEGGEGETEGGDGEAEGGYGEAEGGEGEAEGGEGEAEGGEGEAEVGEGEAEGDEGEGGGGAAYSPRGEYEHLPPDPAPDTPPAHGPDPPEEKANVKIKVEIKQEPKDEVTEEGEGEEEVQEEVKEALKLDIKEEIKEEPVEKPQVEEPPEEIERRPATRSGNVARRLRSHKSALSQSESEEPPPSLPLPLPMPMPMPLPLPLPLPSTSGCVAVDIKPFDTHPASVPAASSASSSSSAGEGWPRLLAPAPAAAPAPVTRTPLSLLLDKVAKWQIVPREGTEHLPCRVYGAIHLARLFVKLPEFLNETQISDFKLKLVLKHIDMFVQYLDEHSEWFGENYYLSDSMSRAT